MIIDASALIAILLDESEARSSVEAIASTSSRRVSAVSYVEAGVVIDGSMEGGIPLRADGLTIPSERQNSSLSRLPRPKRGLPARPTAISARAAVILWV